MVTAPRRREEGATEKTPAICLTLRGRGTALLLVERPFWPATSASRHRSARDIATHHAKTLFLVGAVSRALPRFTGGFCRSAEALGKATSYQFARKRIGLDGERSAGRDHLGGIVV